MEAWDFQVSGLREHSEKAKFFLYNHLFLCVLIHKAGLVAMSFPLVFPFDMSLLWNQSAALTKTPETANRGIRTGTDSCNGS